MKSMPSNLQDQRPWSDAGALRALLVLFFLWGFLTCLNDTLVPHLKALFALSYAHAVLVPLTFFATCFLFAPVSSEVIAWLGYRRSMVAGLMTMAAGALAFVPATQLHLFVCFLIAVGVIGAGITLLQASAAPYVAFLGPPETAPSRFSLALAFNSIGTMVAPLFGSWLILRTPAHSIFSSSLAPVRIAEQPISMDTLRGPYIFLGLVLILMAAGLAFSGLPEMRSAPDPPASAHPVTSVFRHRPLVFGAVTVCIYAGSEVGIGSLLINYLAHPAVLGMSRQNAAMLATIYWGGAAAGRLWGWRLLRHYRAETVLMWISATAAALVTISVSLHGVLSAAAVLSVGLCNALIVPIVVMLAISGLGPLTARANSTMVAANIGAGLIPLGLGVLADRVGIHHALTPTILCYCGVFCYAVFGCKGHFLPRPSVDDASSSC